jgi:hypothetical protein
MMSRKFKSAAEQVSVYEDDFKDVCAVLAGPSKWLEFFRHNIPIAIKAMPSRKFQFLNGKEFEREGRPNTLGVTSKVTGEIKLLDISSNNAGFAAMGAALHELVHLVSHPPQQGKRITVFEALGEGLMEGLTHVVTEDILTQQGIAPFSGHGYGDRVKIVRRLIEVLQPNSVRMFGRALFLGNLGEVNLLAQFLGSNAFREVKNLATMHNSAKAIQCIDTVVKASASKSAGAAGRK